MVFACHSPDEGVVGGSGDGMDGPFGGDDGLFVSDYYVSGFCWVAHEVHDDVVFGEVEI